MTIIGLDPHPNGHTAVALDRSRKIAGSLTVPNEAAGCRHLLSWSQGLGERCWAVEVAGNRFVAGPVRQLQAAGERIYNIHTRSDQPVPLAAGDEEERHRGR